MFFTFGFVSNAHSWPHSGIDIREVEYHASDDFFVNEKDRNYEEIDIDHDMINDAEENAIAWFFRPFLSFEADSIENARRPGEPVENGEPLVLFQVQPVGPDEILDGDNPEWAACETGGDYSQCRGIWIQYVMLWEMDGGGVDGGHGTHFQGELCCNDDCNCGLCHEGDSQEVTFWLRSEDGGSSWTAEEIWNGEESGCFKRDYNGLDKYRTFYDDVSGAASHVQIYYSAGKHHQYFYPGCFNYIAGRKECEYFWRACCEECILDDSHDKVEFLPEIYPVGEKWMFIRPSEIPEENVDYFHKSNNCDWRQFGYINNLSDHLEIDIVHGGHICKGYHDVVYPVPSKVGPIVVNFDQGGIDEYAWSRDNFCGGFYHLPTWCDEHSCGASPVGDFWRHDIYPDPDWDGHDNDIDNCTGTWNPMQGDGDGAGDACDRCPDVHVDLSDPDFDGDCVGDHRDNCPTVANVSQEDRDDDTIGDACDYCKRQDPQNIGVSIPPIIPGGGPYPRSKDLIEELDPASYTVIAHPENDPDGDKKGNLCDNCPTVPNADQWNCNEPWEIATRPGGEFWWYEDEPIEGDACDPDPCVDVNGIDRSTDSLGGSMDMTLRSSGYNEAMERTYIYKDVMKAYCDCAQYRFRRFDECIRYKGCEKFNYVREPWESPELHRDTCDIYPEDRDMQAVRFTQLYYGVGEDRRCDGSWSPQWGCDANDAQEFYEGEYGDLSIYNLTFSWDWTREFNCYLYPMCDVSLWLFFKPTDRGALSIDSWPMEKNAYYSPEIYTLSLSVPTPGGGWPFPEEFGWPFSEKYIDFGDEGCPVLLDDDFYVLLDLIDVGCPMTDPEKWQYPGLKPDSASRGMIIGKFSFGKGGFEEFYRSVFIDPDDIVDVKGASIAHQRMFQPADAVAAGWQNPDTAAYPGRIWIFGGRDLAGYRGDLWLGTPFVTQEGEIVFSWQREITQANGPAPSQAPQPRQDAVLISDPVSSRLLVFGGFNEGGALSDLWSFDTASGTWTEQAALGSVPVLQPGYARARAVDSIYLWNPGEDLLYRFHIPTLTFERRYVTNAPSNLADASICYDCATEGLYLFGGFDGQQYHNHLWFMDPDSMAWSLVEPDCASGACPDLTADPVLVSSATGARLAVVPGTSAEADAAAFIEPFYMRTAGRWQGGREAMGEAGAGDCDGDTIVEEGYGTLCSSFDAWYQEPGGMVCDSFTHELVCDQEEPSAAQIASRTVRGVRSLIARDGIVYVAQGNKILSYDASDIHSPMLLDELRIGAPVRDMAASGEVLVAAADAALVVVGMNETFQGELGILSESPACGRPVAVEENGGRFFFLTPLGIGEIDLTDRAAPQLARFSLVLPAAGRGWRIVPVDVSLCGYISDMAEFLCDLFGCAMGHRRPFDVSKSTAILTIRRDFIVIDVSAGENFEYLGSLRLPRRATDLKAFDGFSYANLAGARTALVDIEDPSSPLVVGTHDLSDWVKGVEFEPGRAYRIVPGGVEAAAWEAWQ